MTSSSQRYWSTTKLGVIALVVWLGILAATLRPFNPWPRNEVHWLAENNGIHFGRNGVVSSEGSFPAAAPGNAHPCSVEVWLRPENETDVHTFLSFYAPGDFLPFELRQYVDGLLIFRRFRDAREHISSAEIDVDHVFHRASPTLITITSGGRGTKVYLNGELVQSAPGFHIYASNLSGELLLGSAAINYDAWSGDMRGLAIYERELDVAQVQQHFSEWSQGGTLTDETAEGALAEYSFDERSGTLVHNHVSKVGASGESATRAATAGQTVASEPAAVAPDLEIPEHYQVPHKAFLQPPWKEITPLWIYVDDIVRNIAGFIPLGVVFYLYLARIRRRGQAISDAIALGALTSLAIEILQAYVPQRVSGITDIITNTLGTAVGVLLLQPRPIRVMLETWGILATPQSAAAMAPEARR